MSNKEKYKISKKYKIFYLGENNQIKELVETWCNGQRHHSIFREEGYDSQEEAEHVLNLWCEVNNGTRGKTFVVVPVYVEVKVPVNSVLKAQDQTKVSVTPFDDADKPSLCGIYE